MKTVVKTLIEKLNLTPHPEGGYFREIYKSDEIIDAASLPSRYNSLRSFSTSIYYLLAENDISHFHKLKSDEIWHFYAGSKVIIHCLDENSGYDKIILGNDIAENIFPQYIIKNGIWFAAEIQDKNSYSLIGCTVAPGFDYSDFELAERIKLLNKFPDYKKLILDFT